MENAGKIINGDQLFFRNLFFQGGSMISLVLWIIIAVLLIRLILLGIKALKIYINKNS